MTRNIYFSVCGEGYGHSSRDLAIAKALSENGCEILMGGYGYVFDRLSRSFKSVKIQREFEMVGNGGSFDLKATILRSKKTAFQFSKLISEEKKIMQEFNATCVVADGRSAAVFAAFSLGIPCVIISNQTSLEPFFKESSFFVRLLGKPVEMTLKTITALAENTIIPDFSPPDTVCIKSLSNSPHIMKKQSFVGPVVSIDRDSKNDVPMNMKTPFVLTLLGGHSYRLPIFDNILKIANRFPEMNFLIFTIFKSDTVPENVRIMEFAEDISSYMKAAEIIITQAGHSTAMEIMTLGKASLLIPDQGQTEQESNSERMKELGVCETIQYSSLSADLLSAKIEALLSDERYKEKAMYYSEMARKMNGPVKAAGIIMDLSERIQYY
ncbi:MAG: UDP-N-acetylglucosamine--N-acetylmuramyl-(pentapeptide) pyrophosphoryl-undecaprenol N-acetylglucosamine transferase [Candidatus Methanoperedens sp.]|nr:UDP-N-acetylglucosamine--N-acetylmuramyl-(pentapeptide) pyrophosphoryl-undecaprenol N-acetylglucosamine transferase [Candidatus Methanoperedens sp.]MCE8424917.1 UDP-N-acetylglucosamine--N-acetylmuramyl-(pentapeptide) pyrophosphoryl-undecaprenol N-acetylglucosamine transferase [Candidatus Methanoperedens sp.]MCE8428703.1 UDP-N-acetylglucosamine--N-acetylmuramyl-(pentapeptide) pyrophosphoryl-undecaprenol N-acetylglucosamine transferase [Candidatus Methanoperedens sp.]